MRRRTIPITESVETLHQRENQYRHQPQELRLKALRLLKDNPNATLQQVAHLLRRHLRTVQRWWKTYQEQGVQGVIQFSQGGGRRPMRLPEAGLRALEQPLQPHRFTDLREVQRWLQERWGVCSTYSGVW